MLNNRFDPFENFGRLSPNIGECWGCGTATFLMMVDVGTRSCGLCVVKTGRPAPLDRDEPRRVVEVVHAMNLHHVVITSVNRDERKDGCRAHAIGQVNGGHAAG